MTDTNHNGGDNMGDCRRECPIIAREVGELTQAMKDLKETVLDGFAGTNKRLDKQNGRIGKLEAWRWKLAGGITVGIAILKMAGLI